MPCCAQGDIAQPKNGSDARCHDNKNYNQAMQLCLANGSVLRDRVRLAGPQLGSTHRVWLCSRCPTVLLDRGGRPCRCNGRLLRLRWATSQDSPPSTMKHILLVWPPGLQL